MKSKSPKMTREDLWPIPEELENAWKGNARPFPAHAGMNRAVMSYTSDISSIRTGRCVKKRTRRRDGRSES